MAKKSPSKKRPSRSTTSSARRTGTRPIKKSTGRTNSTTSPTPLVRLNKFIADSGFCSRRKADQFIKDGQVIINGKKVFELGIKVDAENDRVTVSGTPLKPVTKKLYYMLHKPVSVVTTMNDPSGRPTIEKFITTPERLFPVGRLDWDSEGLLLLTNDGHFSQKVTHPKEEIPKTYLVKVSGNPDDKKLQKLLNGVTIVGGKVKAQLVEPIKRAKTTKYGWFKIVISEGKNRQIRKMFEKIDCDVIKLQRVAIGKLRIGSLKRGDMRALSQNDIDKVFATFDKNDERKG